MPSVLRPLSTETTAESTTAPEPLAQAADSNQTVGEREVLPRAHGLSGPGNMDRPTAASNTSATSTPGHPPSAASPGALPFQTGSAHATGFEPAPLPPEWIRSGRPEPRSKPLTRSADGRLSSGLWECPAGCFTYIFPCDEIVHILEGDVIVESQGERRHLKTGDVAHFPQDLHTVWTIRHHVKKLAIFRAVPRPLLKRIASRLFKQ